MGNVNGSIQVPYYREVVTHCDRVTKLSTCGLSRKHSTYCKTWTPQWLSPACLRPHHHPAPCRPVCDRETAPLPAAIFASINRSDYRRLTRTCYSSPAVQSPLTPNHGLAIPPSVRRGPAVRRMSSFSGRTPRLSSGTSQKRCAEAR